MNYHYLGTIIQKNVHSKESTDRSQKQRNTDAEIDDEEMEEESEIDEEDDHEQLTDAQNDGKAK